MHHLETKNLEPVIANIQQLLANLHIHYHNLRVFHWNVTGRHFLELHKHLEELYGATEQMIDEVAERLRALGVYVRQSLQENIAMAECEEQPQLTDPWKMIDTIRQSNEIIIQNLEAIVRAADKAEDFGSSDMFATQIREIEKQNWMLSALLQQ